MFSYASTLKLEILHEPAQGNDIRPPVLFVHGAYVGAWCWAKYFLPHFARHGHPAWALSLRGHGGSAGRERLHLCGIDDYADDIRRAIEQIGVEPVLVGHSMGGVVVQRYLENASAPAAVMMAAVPPEGLLGSGLRMALFDPFLFGQMHLFQCGYSALISPDALKRAIFSDDVSTHVLTHAFARAQQESQRAIFEMSWPLARLYHHHPDIPTLVLAAGNDALFPPGLAQSSARALNSEPVVFPGMAHAMMLEPRWQEAADAIIHWLDKTL
jgi:pimeloyl-ACP methyl ester carboxylesterase